MTQEIKIGVMGCTGRMGKMIVREILSSADSRFAGGTVRPKSPNLGDDIGVCVGRDPVGFFALKDATPVFEQSDVVIDFTRATATVEHVHLAQKYHTPLVIGTTGLSKNQREDIINASKKVPIVFSPNMSIGVTLLNIVVEKMAELLDSSFDIEVVEMRHRNKLEAPSGTAIALGQAAARGRKTSLEESAMRCRTGKRQFGEIGFAVLRGGEVIGDSKVVFAGDHEMIEFSHRSLSREVFASGSVKAAKWLVKQNPGLYTMREVLASDR